MIYKARIIVHCPPNLLSDVLGMDNIEDCPTIDYMIYRMFSAGNGATSLCTVPDNLHRNAVN